jgi:hypothetical protein
MNIDDLLRFRDMLREQLSEINSLEVPSTVQKINSILDYTKVQNQMAVSPEFIDAWRTYANIASLIKHADANLLTTLEQITHKVKDLALARFPDIGEIQHRYLTNSQHVELNKETLKTIRSRLFINADFRYPVLQFGCNTSSEVLTKDLVANDPLYMCDYSVERIEFASGQFNPVFNQRIRKYVIENNSFSRLPQGQFGLILTWMVFNYADRSAIKNYLQKMMLLLKPGGVHIFSYNNCEFLESYQLADKGWMSYVTKTDVLALCTELGYEIVNTHDIQHARYDYERISWVEIKKPGVLKSARLKQVVGSIVVK